MPRPPYPVPKSLQICAMEGVFTGVGSWYKETMLIPAPKTLFSKALITLTASLLCSACAAGMDARQEKAQSLAGGAQLTRQDIKASSFVLGSWRKLTAPDQPVHVYIEGDGLAWLSRSEPSLNPTPKNPLALQLATLDPAPNVIYIARPCQYVALDAPGNTACSDSNYWRGKRFAPEIIASYQAALDGLTASYPAGFELIGYSGGANIAGLIAQGRKDVISLRTVAGNIDNDYFTQYHSVSAMPASLNMADEAALLTTLPQLHFIGGNDTSVPADIYKNYALKTNGSVCVHSKILPDVTHEDGWVEQWPALLSLPMACQ